MLKFIWTLFCWLFPSPFPVTFKNNHLCCSNTKNFWISWRDKSKMSYLRARSRKKKPCSPKSSVSERRPRRTGTRCGLWSRRLKRRVWVNRRSGERGIGRRKGGAMRSRRGRGQVWGVSLIRRAWVNCSSLVRSNWSRVRKGRGRSREGGGLLGPSLQKWRRKRKRRRWMI